MRPDLGLYAAFDINDVVTKNPNYNGMLYEEKAVGFWRTPARKDGR